MAQATDVGSPVAIARPLLDQLQAEARQAGEQECCGLLFGQPGHITAFQPTANVAADPARGFEINPADLFAAVRAARHGGPPLLGCYHSHPTGNIQPSPDDELGAARAEGLCRYWLILTGCDSQILEACPRPGGIVLVPRSLLPFPRNAQETDAAIAGRT